MRRYLAGALFFAMLLESSGSAFAYSPETIKPIYENVARSHRVNAPISKSMVGALPASFRYPIVRHTPLPPRPMANYGSRRRYARLIPRPAGIVKLEHVALPIDLVKLRREHHYDVREPLKPQVGEGRQLDQLGQLGQLGQLKHQGSHRVSKAQLNASLTGLWPWWAYKTRPLPGIGTAMVNVINLNFLLLEDDVDIPAGELDLSFSRVYNSESQHDDLNDDNSTPSVYGNRWTNNLDTHLAATGSGNTLTISVYTGDGARDDFACNVTQTSLCTASTAGIYDLLAPTQIGGSGVACQFQLTKKSGVSYIFNAPYQGCNFGQGLWGRLLAIYGRNSTFSIQLTYSWTNGDDSNPENISQITATHENAGQPDGEKLQLEFSTVAGSSPEIAELSSITRPDGQSLFYYYTTNGELVDVSKPGNNPVLPTGENMPTNFADGNAIGTGNLPETYDIEQTGLLEVCGPRAAIAIINNASNPPDGACVDFDYSNHQLSDWFTRGVLNPTPGDNVMTSPIQSGPSTSFFQWPDTTFFGNMSGNGCNNASVMTDAFGHNVEWCYDSNNRLTQTIVLINPSDFFLYTSQTWDANNNLTSMTDPRNYTTNIAYDANGNVVEIALPSQTTSKGTLQPTYLYDHDSYNNLIKYCDPANNASNDWNPNPGPTPCAASGSSKYATYTYNDNDANEPYGCLNAVIPPSQYNWAIGYGGGCGNGLPINVAGTQYTQHDQTNRIPAESFSYYTNGTLETFGNGVGTWQYYYTTNGMNRVRSVADPDRVTSWQCYNQDGSIFYSETAQQDVLDGNNGNGPNCPTVAQLEAGSATPPPYAVSYTYNPDGGTATTVHHNGCVGGGPCVANTPAPTKCNSVTVLAGATCDFYDGLDRLVEVKQPPDSKADLYTNPWITRYLYDLTGSTYSFHGNTFNAYGNLFETQELVAPTPTPSAAGTPLPQLQSVSNANYVPLAAFAYDGADRLVTKYKTLGVPPSPGAANYSTENLFWDTSPLDPHGVAGYLGKDCNGSATPNPNGQCQQFDYYPDGEEETFNSNDGSSPERSYTYDPDGRPYTIAESGYNNPQSYSYDVDGNLVTASDAGGADHATLTYGRYPDGSEAGLSVASTALNQSPLFQYSYWKDGTLKTYLINDSNVTGATYPGQTTLTYTYTPGARLLTRGESGAGVNTNPSPPPTTITYATTPPNATGLIQSETTPVASLSSFQYTAEDEMTQVSVSSGTFNCTGTSQYGYSVRGELTLSPGCPIQQSVDGYFANGAATRFGFSGNSTFMWNDLMGVLASVNANGSTSSWNYDAVGRMNIESEPYPRRSPSPLNYTTTRAYDAENRLNLTTFASPQPNGSSYEKVQWGPDGHPIVIGSSLNSGPEQDERLHWAGDQLLFTTHEQTGQVITDDIKVDVQGDILPGDGGYSGLTFYDRGPGGTIMGCHNYNGTSFAGLGDSWQGIALSPCSTNRTPNTAEMPTSTVWSGSPYNGGLTIGGGGTLGMPRTDGFTDDYDTIQGVRAYDNTSGSWTTPDEYAGGEEDPASQKSYLWNGNDPMDSADPSGYIDNHAQPQSISTPSPQPPAASGPGGIPSKCGATGCLKVIVTVVAHCNCVTVTVYEDGSFSAPSANQGPPHCEWGSDGLLVCQGQDDHRFRPLPNIMARGEHPNCFVPGMEHALLILGGVSAFGGTINAVRISGSGGVVGPEAFGLGPTGLTIGAATILGGGIFETYKGC